MTIDDEGRRWKEERENEKREKRKKKYTFLKYNNSKLGFFFNKNRCKTSFRL